MIYDRLTDAELIREADGHGGLVQALAERLDMRRQPDSVFHDQAAFMRACSQTTTTSNPDQAALYRRLIAEESDEFWTAFDRKDEVEGFDATLDLIVVLIGYGLSKGWPMDEGWAEVMRSNFAKINPQTGLVNKRPDGKVLKPAGWTPPDLAGILSAANKLI
jgi:predicted HAD superfamily Cof-like phosphohydrolase